MGFLLKLFFKLIMREREHPDKYQLREQCSNDNEGHLLAEAVSVRIEFHSAGGFDFVKSDESLRLCDLQPVSVGRLSGQGD